MTEREFLKEETLYLFDHIGENSDNDISTYKYVSNQLNRDDLDEEQRRQYTKLLIRLINILMPAEEHEPFNGLPRGSPINSKQMDELKKIHDYFH